jgi:L-fucose isomerase-like protein
MNKLDLDIDELFFYLEEKVRDNHDCNEIAELYEDIMKYGRIHKKYSKLIRKLKKEIEKWRIY